MRGGCSVCSWTLRRSSLERNGREGWLRAARHQLDRYREQNPWPVPRSRVERLLEAERRLAQDLAVEHEANQAYEEYRRLG